MNKLTLFFLKKRRHGGFALVASITLMLLISLVAIALMTLSVSTARVTSAGRDMEEARAQARLALEIALGKLQCELGPDQRVSAASGIVNGEMDGRVPAEDQVALGSGSEHVLGVWNSWDNWLNRSNSKGRAITSTYGQGRSSQFRTWLISSPNMREITEWNSVKNRGGLGSGSGNQLGKVLLLGEGTIGPSKSDQHVFASLVEVDTSKSMTGQLSQGKQTGLRKSRNRKGYLAWWIAGENLKARINMASNKPESRSEIELLRRSWDTPIPDYKVISGLEKLSSELDGNDAESNNNRQKIITRDTLSLLSMGGSAKRDKGNFHSATLDSSGLIVDVRWGGLKKDLSTMLSSNSFQSSDYYESSGADVGIRPYSSEDGNGKVANNERPFASWKQLYYWYNMWKGKTFNGQDQSAPLKWAGRQPYTVVAADPGTGVMNNRYTYMRQPVLLKMYIFAGFVLVFHDTYVPFDGLDGEWGARPVFVWWNPYNVPLVVGEDSVSMGAFGGAYRTYPIQHSYMSTSQRYDDSGNGRTFSFPWLKYSEGVFSTYDGGLLDQGNSFRRTVDERKLTFEPGEIKVFTQDLQYDMKNNSGRVFNRSYDDSVDANHFVNRFEGHEITYEQKNKYAPTNTIPVLFKYTTGVGKPEGDNTPGRFICLGWMWRTDIINTYLDLRLPAGKSALLRPQDGDQSMYQLWLKENSKENGINFTVGAGLMTKDASMSAKELQEGKAIERYFPSFMNINWIDEKPYPFILGGEGLQLKEPLFNVMWNGDGMPARKGGTWGEPNNDGNPFWVSYYGISPKTVNGPADIKARYKGEDARTKTWQHSSPAFWGSQLPNPTELLRKHHPYQFEIKQRESNDYTQLDIISGDVVGQIISNSQTGSSGEDAKAYFGYRDEDMVSTIVALELPIHPPFSLAGFASARLTPGWYEEAKVKGKGEISALRSRRFAYQSGVPGVGIGTNFADPMIPADKVHYNYTEHHEELADFWDHGLMINDVLWDSWFTSSMSDRPTNIGSGVTTRSEVISEAVDNYFSENREKTKELPNSRFKLNPQHLSPSELINTLSKDTPESWTKPAQYLTIEGAFNVNSTSVEAWTAVLNGLKERGILYADKKSGEPKVLSSSLDGEEVYLKRFAVASSDQTRYGQPLLRIEGLQNEYLWSDLRKLKAARSASDNSEISTLAKMIVAQVRKRGPFLNMSEFINRTFKVNDSSSLYGPLDAAIKASGLNDEFETTSMTLKAEEKYNHPKASAGSIQTASPGYLVASDILSVLGNTLTVRDDTFTIRAYGQVSDPSGSKIIGRAWCEAVVQRMIDYVDPSNTPEVPAYTVNQNNGDITKTDLSNANKAFGRKFKIVSFRWLAPEEV